MRKNSYQLFSKKEKKKTRVVIHPVSESQSNMKYSL